MEGSEFLKPESKLAIIAWLFKVGTSFRVTLIEYMCILSLSLSLNASNFFLVVHLFGFSIMISLSHILLKNCLAFLHVVVSMSWCILPLYTYRGFIYYFECPIFFSNLGPTFCIFSVFFISQVSTELFPWVLSFVLIVVSFFSFLTKIFLRFFSFLAFYRYKHTLVRYASHPNKT